MAKDVEQKNAAFEFMTKLLVLLELYGVATDRTPWNLSVNFHGAARRLDIARLTPDGQGLEAWVMGIDMNLVDLQTFGTPIGLPTPSGQTH
jgi:hypothetical protein